MDGHRPAPPVSSCQTATAGYAAVALSVASVGLCWGSTGGVLALAGPDGRRLFVQLTRADTLTLVRWLRSSRLRSQAPGEHPRPLPMGGPRVLGVGLAEGDDGAPIGLLAVGRPGVVRELACSPGAAAFWAVFLNLPVWVAEEDLRRWAAVGTAPSGTSPDEPLASAIRQLLADIDALDRL